MYFATDKIGRRSLTIHIPSSENDFFCLSSVPECESGWEEIESGSFGVLYLNNIKNNFEKGYLEIENKMNLKTKSEHYALESNIRNLDFSNNPFELNKAELKIVQEFKQVLYKAIEKRTITVHKTNSFPRIAVLFSGGIDCTIIAYLISLVLPTTEESIDLINVAFENPRTNKKLNNNTYNVPDRISAIEAFHELQTLHPHRKFNLVLVDVPYKQMLEHKEHILKLCFPKNTVMDLSIALPFWFSSRGIGYLYKETSNEYKSPAKVLFSGLGIDEQLGGYTRHRSAYIKGGIEFLSKEILKDTQRIGTRNLARDDRVVSDNGKEIRYPYLDEEVIEYLNTLPVISKANMRYGKGVGDKILIRRLAHIFGFTKTSTREKRAVQFGSRSAKMEAGTRNTKGTDALK